MNIINMIINLSALIPALSLIIVAVKSICSFFSPTSRQLRKYVNYKKNYSKFYDMNTNNFLNYQIKFLSLIKLTKLSFRHGQITYFKFLDANRTAKIDLYILQKLLDSAFINKSFIIDVSTYDVKKFEFRISIGWVLFWWFMLIFGVIWALFMPIAVYYNVYILYAQTLSSLEIFFYIAAYIFLIAMFVIYLFYNKPISKSTFQKHINLINDWNEDIKDRLEKQSKQP